MRMGWRKKRLLDAGVFMARWVAAGAAEATPEERAAAGRRLKELAAELEARYAEWEAVGARRDGLARADEG